MEQKDIGKLISLLGEDVSDQYAKLLSEDSQLLRRAFIRSFFAYVEGVTYVLKRNALNYASRHPTAYTVAEMAMMAEENYGLNNKGEVSTQRKFLPTAENFLFSMRIYLKEIPDVGLDIDLGSTEWQNFIKALQVRHRIVHPKSEADVEISDAERELVMRVGVWFNYVVVSRLLESVDSLKRSIERIKSG